MPANLPYLTNLKFLFPLNQYKVFTLFKEIKLEANDESLISFPFDICVLDSFFCISSRSTEIKLYDLEGNFIRAIGQKGKGPGEYFRITSIFPVGPSMFGVYDIENNKVIIYNINGDLIKDEKL